MTWGVLNAAMLAGLIGVSLPVIIHFLNRRRDPIIEWGAMQFLDIGRRARQRLRLTELLLMLARMGLLAAVALALARPFLAPNPAAAKTKAGAAALVGGPARDVVVILDGSAGMSRAAGGTTPRARAIAEARTLVGKLNPGDSVALLVASERVRPIVDPPVFDRERVDTALANLGKTSHSGRGTADIPAALADAFRVLERGQNPAREVVIFTDGRRAAWHPGDLGRWSLLRELHRRMPVSPRVWSRAVGSNDAPDAPNGSVGRVSVSRALVTPGLPINVNAEVENAGPGPLSRTAELLVDGKAAPGATRAVGPVPAGGKTPLTFTTTLNDPGSHLLTVRLVGGDDALPADDEASAAVEVAPALNVLLVDGEPGREPFTGEVDFLRAALAPTGDDTPQAHATVVTVDGFTTDALKSQRILILANVERLDPEQTLAVARFLEAGGGVLVASGDRCDTAFWNGLSWLPATLGDRVGDYAARKTVAHPAPATFSGPVLPPFSQGEAPPLASADLFAYRVLEPASGASVSARLDTKAPWAVERGQGRGRVLVLAGPLDAEGGTLPVNPDFVPLIHEWALHLAGGSAPRPLRPGEPAEFELNPAPPATVTSLPLLTPSGDTARASIVRTSTGAKARHDETSEPGVYRLARPDPPGGFDYAVVQGDSSLIDDSPLDPAEAAKLAEGWPLEFAPDADRLTSHLFTTGPGARRELWRGLVLAALAGLCAEVYLTRKLVRGQGLTGG
jgi:von Willebrand factor type A domain/Aerotolerance regulator N-terminal